MQQILNFIADITAVQLIDIIIAIGIVLFFRIFGSSISYLLIRMFKLKAKKAKEIKQNAFYQPLKIVIQILGVYLAILFLQQPFNIDEKYMLFVAQLFKIVSIIAFAKALAQSFMPKTTLVRKIQERSSRELEDSSLNFLLKIIRVIIYLVAGFLVITQLGFDLSGIVAGLGIGGVILTLAAQDTAKNLFGGLMIFLDKPFVVGDWIQIDPFEGTVEDITFRSTRIRTFENSVANIPNATISNSSIINWSRMEKRRYKTNLCLELGTSLEKVEIVKQRIHDMLQQHDDIIDDSILVKFDEITDNGINLLIYSYTNSVDYASFLEEKEKINRKIMQILREEKIELAYDTKTIYVKQ